MIKKKWGKAIAVLMALSIMGSNTQVVNALENDANNQELNGKEMIEETEKANPEIGDKANSWRYKDGEPIYSKLRYKGSGSSGIRYRCQRTSKRDRLGES